MRIITGALGGRTIHEPHGHKTHPMSEKIRGALFNTLGDIEGLTVLDAFAGSGALAVEAASRGAKNVVAIDKEREAHGVIERNIKELHLEKVAHVSRANAGGWSEHNMEKKYDIVLLDPPYDQLQLNLMRKLVRRHVKKGGLAVLSFPGGTAIPDFDDTKVVTDKQYGDAQLVFYRKINK